MKTWKKIIIIMFLVIIFLYSIIPPKTVYAEQVSGLSQESAGKVIAEFAKNFFYSHGQETKYNGDDSTCYDYRQKAYNGEKVNGYYQMDCVGWINFAVHFSLGLDTADKGLYTGFAIPPGNSTTGFHSGFDTFKGDINGNSYIDKGTILSEAKPGDILFKYNGQHVLLYVGDGYVIHCAGRGPGDPGGNQGWGLRRERITNMTDEFCAIGRITDNAARNLIEVNVTWNGEAPANGGIIIPDVDDSSAFNKYINGDITGKTKLEKFYYNGTPKKGQYLGKTEEENWIFKTIENAADWLLGIATMNIKVQVVGWTGIFDKLANKFVAAVTGEKDLKDEDRITVEKVIYNKVPILDVNLFNFDKAGGKDLKISENPGDNLIYNLRVKIAQWYVIIRDICIIILLLVLIYLGIRTAISSVAKDKADYKEKLIAWITGFVVVMFIHYFMVIVLNINQIAVGWVTPPTDTSGSFFEQMRNYAYEIPASKGWMGAIMYVFLVYFLIKMLFFYFKRLLIVYILAIISPILGIVYSIQKINGKSKALGIWAKEFAFNVLIQFIHAAIYSIMIGFILTSITNTKVSNLLPYTVFLLILLNFLLGAEDIIKNIFKIETNSLKSILATVFDFKEKFAAAFVIGGAIYGVGKPVVLNEYDKGLTKSLNNKYDKYKIQDDSEFAKSVNTEIERLKAEEKAHIHELNSNAINFAKSQFNGAVSLVASVPGVFEKPVAGALGFAYAANNLNSGLHTGGKMSSNASKLDKSTEGTEYVYIDNPNHEAINVTEIVQEEVAQSNNNSNRYSGTIGQNSNNVNGVGNSEAEQKNSKRSTSRKANNGENSDYEIDFEEDDQIDLDETDNINYIQSEDEENLEIEIESGRVINEVSRKRVRKSQVGQPKENETIKKETKNVKKEKNVKENKSERKVKKNIKKYNTKKIKTYAAPRALLSWATVGRSRLAENVLKDAINEDELVSNVYSTRIQKLSVIGNLATKRIHEINRELYEMKRKNYPPVYYTPSENEDKTQRRMNEMLREKYREILEQNVIQIYEGVNKAEINDHVVNKQTDKVNLKDIEEMAKDYLSERKCDVGEDFKENLNDELRSKIIDTVTESKKGFERIKLKPEIEEKLRKAIQQNSEDEEKLKLEVDKIITPQVKDQIVSKISIKDLTELIAKTLEKKGSIEINKDFQSLQEPIENLRLLNEEAKATTGKKVYTTEQLLDLIMNKDITE